MYPQLTEKIASTASCGTSLSLQLASLLSTTSNNKIMPKPMTIKAASRIYRAACLANNGCVSAGSFAARAMSAAMRNSRQEHVSHVDDNSTCFSTSIYICAAVGAAVGSLLLITNLL